MTTIPVDVFVATPFAALIAAVPIAWGWGLRWADLVLAAPFTHRGHHRLTATTGPDG
jgi:stearoyl-CoA desaturase (Delta-9 desaturase)